MYRVFPLIFMLLLQSSYAGLSIQNDKDRSIFEDTVVLSSQILAKDPKDKYGNALLKFVIWMHNSDSRVKELQEKVVFGEHFTALKGNISRELLVRKIATRSEELREEVSKRML